MIAYLRRWPERPKPGGAAPGLVDAHLNGLNSTFASSREPSAGRAGLSGSGLRFAVLVFVAVA
jgi:hypothetical protein